MKKSCKNCMYSVGPVLRDGGFVRENHLYCGANPPTPVYDMGFNEIKFVFPQVSKGFFCKNFTPKSE